MLSIVTERGPAPKLIGGFLLSVVVVGSLVAVPRARATMSTCSYQDAEDTVYVQTVTPTKIRFFVTAGGEFKWEDPMSGKVSDCGKATVNNVDVAQVTDFNSADVDSWFILDLRRRMGPGKTPEGAGISEIEFTFQGGTGDDTLEIRGGKRADEIVFGDEGTRLNGDGDTDITQIDGYDDFLILGKGRADFLSAGGGNGTGGPFTSPLMVYGNGGNDDIVGSTKVDRLFGSDGRDRIRGDRSGDIIFGDDGADVLLGRSGGDELDGMGGADRLRGHSGSDDLEGGAGDDNCKGGPGTDTVAGCESGGG